jgi:hypothetical protein
MKKIDFWGFLRALDESNTKTDPKALCGFLVGAIPGAILGLALGACTNAMACSGSDRGDIACCHNHSDPTLTAVLGLGLVTGGIGALIGALVGHRTVYEF